MIARVEERFERQARNEALMRAVNEQIAALGGTAGSWADSEQQFDFQCECGRAEACESRVLMTRSAYERVRRQRDRFAVVPGHQTDELEYVVEEGNGYVIVDKRDEYEQFVE
jgi:diaminopimelate decarboxylase